MVERFDFETVNVTEWLPGVEYVTVGFCTFDDEGEPPGKLQLHDVIELGGRNVELSVKNTESQCTVKLKSAASGIATGCDTLIAQPFTSMPLYVTVNHPACVNV